MSRAHVRVSLAWAAAGAALWYALHDAGIHATISGVLLAQELGADLTLLHVRTVPGSSIPEGLLAPTEESTHDDSGPADRPLAAWKVTAEQLGASHVAAATSIGDPAQEITDCVRRGDFDAIVIGTHGRTGLKRAVLGSVAEKVVRLAPCVVISVTPEAAGRWG